MMYFGQQIFDFYYYFFTVYSISIFSLYIIMMLISVKDIIHYFKKNSYINYVSILSSPFAPSISVLAPVYNEEANAVACIKSVLANHYVNYEVIVVNDGSTDDTLQNLIDSFSLEKVEYTINQKIETEAVKAVYKSTNNSYGKVIVIDKENGGKSDALNAALNVAKHTYALSIDGDCLLANDALQKMMKPFLDKSEKPVIAAGGVIRIINDCVIKNGRLIEKRLPKDMLSRFQVLEYMRSFLLARVGWSRAKGLMYITGAFGVFEREKAILVKGYNRKTLGEDMDIIVKIKRYMYETKQEFSTAYVPDPLCWTEAPSDYKSLNKQRRRWARGTIQTLWDHRKICLNPKYGLLGMVGYPIWLIYERFGPIIELCGILYFIGASILGRVNWIYTISFLIATYLFAVMYSLFTILAEEKTFHQYTNKGDLRKLILLAFIEPFTYHIFLIFPALVANFYQIFRVKKKWGKIERRGFQTNLN